MIQIIDGKFDKDGALRVAEKYYEGRADELEKARIVVDICETQSKTVSSYLPPYFILVGQPIPSQKLFALFSNTDSAADETDECATAGKVITCITKEAEKVRFFNDLAKYYIYMWPTLSHKLSSQGCSQCVLTGGGGGGEKYS